jgi:hypothetical protein
VALPFLPNGCNALSPLLAFFLDCGDRPALLDVLRILLEISRLDIHLHQTV